MRQHAGISTGDTLQQTLNMLLPLLLNLHVTAA
jgi:hypothetical protein